MASFEETETAIEHVARLRQEGNVAFTKGEANIALSRYTEALAMLDGGGGEGGAASTSASAAPAATASADERTEHAVGLLLNVSACHLRLSAPELASDAATRVLECYEPDNVKALFRRGVAAMQLGRFDGAAFDLSRAHELEPDNAQARSFRSFVSFCSISLVRFARRPPHTHAEDRPRCDARHRSRRVRPAVAPPLLSLLLGRCARC